MRGKFSFYIMDPGFTARLRGWKLFTKSVPKLTKIQSKNNTHPPILLYTCIGIVVCDILTWWLGANNSESNHFQHFQRCWMTDFYDIAQISLLKISQHKNTLSILLLSCQTQFPLNKRSLNQTQLWRNKVKSSTFYWFVESNSLAHKHDTAKAIP